jgi:hypothetical protein
MNRWIRAALLGASLLGAQPALAGDEDVLARMMRGESALQGEVLERAIAAAEAAPLGSKANPVRVTQPQGQHAYLARLRCSDGKAPEFERRGNVGPGPFGNIVDLYDVRCMGAEPASSEVYMDMYHGGFMEARPVPGFTIRSNTTKGPPTPPTPPTPPPSAPSKVRVQEPTA